MGYCCIKLSFGKGGGREGSKHHMGYSALIQGQNRRQVIKPQSRGSEWKEVKSELNKQTVEKKLRPLLTTRTEAGGG